MFARAITLSRCSALALAVAAGCLAAPAVTKVEPPNWWLRHTRNPIQVLLTGADLKGGAGRPAAKGFRIEVRRPSKNGHYLFAYLTIDPAVKAGKYRFQVNGVSGSGELAITVDEIGRAHV